MPSLESIRLKKKMITTSMLKRHVWMADDDEFDLTVKNSHECLN